MRVFPIFATTMTAVFRVPLGGETGGRSWSSGRSIAVHPRARGAASPPASRGTAALSSTSALGQDTRMALGISGEASAKAPQTGPTALAGGIVRESGPWYRCTFVSAS